MPENLTNFACIKLTQGKVAIVDKDREAAIRKFKWRAVKHQRSYYAKTTIIKNGRQIDISMHRFIARTPFGLVCHHLNYNSLDNRRANLENMDKLSHTLLHQNNRIRKKFRYDELCFPGQIGPTSTI